MYRKYFIQKIVPDSLNPNELVLEPLEEGFDGFVLRLDKGGDPKHVEACRKAVLKYAEEIRDYLPDLSKDIFEKYMDQ